MTSIKQDTKRVEMATLLNVVADEMLQPGHVRDLRAIATAVKEGNNDPVKTGIGCESDFGLLVAGCVSRVLRHDW